MRKRLPDGISLTVAEIALVAFGVGVILAFFLTPQLLAGVEAIVIILLALLLIRGNCRN
jgi:hypothetical protein